MGGLIPNPLRPEPKRSLVERFHYWMWTLAERKDWQGAFPRPLWSRLLRYYDKRAGYNFEYDQ